jgi:hypothetical protein
LRLLENISRKVKFHFNVTRVTGTLHEALGTFIIISHSFLLIMRIDLDESCRENKNTIFCAITFILI